VSADLPLLSMLKTRMHWHQSRQKVLAENVANANTPGFQPKDLQQPSFSPRGAVVGGAAPVAVTDAQHMTGTQARAGEDPRNARRFEVRPSGNAVTLEDEMLKVSQNQADFQMAASLYQKSMQMLRIAIGKAR
jgi:flagellar basal-body rod protein FlgB